MFFSPLAWASILVLMVMFCFEYIGVLTAHVNREALGGSRLFDVKDLTFAMTVSGPKGGLVSRLLEIHCKFILPFLFIGIISRDYASGTIRLIQSSPILIRDFVWGKFLGVAAFCLLIVGLFSIVLSALALSVTSPDILLLLWALFCVFIYFVFLASICIFSSSLSKHPIVGGLISLLIILVFDFIDGIGQASVFGDLFYPLSHQAIIMRLHDGGVDVNDLVTLGIFLLMFVSLTIVNMENGVKSRSVPQKLFRFSMVVSAAILVIAVLPYTPLAVFDVTRTKTQTLHPTMQRILHQMDKGPLEVTHYVNILAPGGGLPFSSRSDGRPAVRYDLWRKYMLYKKDIKINFKYYWGADTANPDVRRMLKAYGNRSNPVKDVAEIMADTYGFDLSTIPTLGEISKEIDINREDGNIHLIKLRYDGRETIVRCLRNGLQLPADEHLYPAFERLITGRKKELFFSMDGNPKSVYLIKHNIIVDKDNKRSWINTGPLMDSIRLSSQALSAEAKSLVVLGPRQPLTDTALARIKKFIDDGGNLIIAAEPEYKQFAQPLLDYVGVKVKDGVIVQPIPSFGSQSVLGFVSKGAYPYLRYLDSNRVLYKQIHVDTVYAKFEVCAGLDVSRVAGFTVVPLFYSVPNISWHVPVVHNYDSLYFQVSRKPGDENGSFPIMSLLTREVKGKRQNIIVSGDASFVSMTFRTMSSKIEPFLLDAYFSLNQDLLSLMTNGVYPADLFRENTSDTSIKADKKGAYLQQVIILYLLPLLILIAGIIVLIKRKRK